MARTFAAALVVDVKAQRGNVLAAIHKLHHEMAGHLQVSNILAAQAKCAEMFTLYPAILSADAFLNHACTVDLDEEHATQALISPLIQTAIEKATTVTEARATGAVGTLAQHYSIETLAEMAKNINTLAAQFYERVRKGEPAEKVLDELFEGTSHPDNPFNTGPSSDAGLGAQPN